MSKPGVPLEATYTPPPPIVAGESKPGVPLQSTYTPRPAIPLVPAIYGRPIMPGVLLPGTTFTNPVSPLMNPFKVPDELISLNIISIHDAQAIRQDVDSLFDLVYDIVNSSSTNFDDYLGLKQVSVNLVEDKVPESALNPTYTLLKEIACQMTCHSFTISNAHKSVVGVLQKLKSYTWDAKAVIALSAFALDYGETRHLTLKKQATRKGNALELHVFRHAEENKPAESDSNLTSNLVKITLELIKGIITLEKHYKSYAPSDVPTLVKAPRDVYTYWAVFSLFACANQRELDIKNNVIARLNIVLTQLNAYLNQIKSEIEAWQDLSWRFDAFRIPSGIWPLLKALIYSKNVDQPDKIIANNATKELLTLDELITTKNLFLFISGVDNIDLEIIKSLKLIHESITNNDKYKKEGNKIVWVPVVEHWTYEIKKKFEYLKSVMPSWYVVECFSLIKGYKPLQEIWNYQGKPIVVVADAGGKLLNENALHPIILWGMEAFPFDPATLTTVSQNWNWFWPAAYNIYPLIKTCVMSEEKYVFVYGGTRGWTEKFHGLLERMKKDLEGTETDIEHFNLATNETNQTKFWLSITHSLLSNIQNVETTTLKQIQMLLAMKTEAGWAIVSKGKNVFLFGYNEVMLNVLQGFKEWRPNISVLGFYSAIYKYYVELHKPEKRHCMKFQLDNIHSRVLIPFNCPDLTCGRMMEITSLSYKCCHGMHFVDDDDLPFENGKGPI
ncbi:protein SIEVE ELEMENT OCCLUSION B [Arachis ipaensis]|uniref:Protein SIEVE ELEMENT OCCLUSION B n=1 Tax=Arachis hypogaea TaxID=3818 RepID=A0A6B9VBT3_ARAHY|nr:protein SIEVE ELEMENT OCCLUSION B [Arachis ipaensis]QHN78154.1 Protein SIEVE ELEMENT OCCLUSION B [Arachis hypogaea]